MKKGKVGAFTKATNIFLEYADVNIHCGKISVVEV